MILAATGCGIYGLLVAKGDPEIIREVIVFSWADVVQTAWLALALPLLIVGGILTVLEKGDTLSYGRAMLAMLALCFFCFGYSCGPYLWACTHGYGDKWVIGAQKWLDRILVALMLLSLGTYLVKFARSRHEHRIQPGDSATV